MRLIFAQSQHATLPALSRAKDILAKVQQGQEGTPPEGSTSAIIASPEYAFIMTILTQRKGSLDEAMNANPSFRGQISNIHGAIVEDLLAITKEFISNSSPNLVKYQAAEEDLLRTSKQAMRYKIAGGALIAGEIVGGVAMAAIGVKLLVAGGAALRGPLAIIAGAGLIGFGIVGGHSSWQEGTELMKKPVMREKLNDIMQEALEHYGKGQSQKFLETLATAYAPGKWLFSLNDFRYGLPREKISESLAEHGFRPDGIAYLFNLMGEALSSGQVEISDCLPSDMNFLADRGFYSSLSEELIDSATTLDGRIAEMRKKNLISMIKEGYRLFRDFFMLRDEGELAKEHVEDAQEMPFTVRLEEMRNIAKLNIAMISLVTDWETPKGDKAALDKTKKLVKEVRGSMDRYGQFHTMSANRLVAIEDFLWVVNGESIPNEVPSFIREPLLATPNQSHTERNMEGQQYLTYLNNRLVAVSSDQEKVKIYNQRAAYYVREAKKVAEANHSESLQYWQAAQTDYTNALMLMDHDQTACLGYARCLLGLSQYDQAFRYLKEHPNLQETPELWIMASIAYRKQANYDNAKKCILEALRQNPHNQEAAREKAVLEAATSPAVT
jgi:tetratricopeptide (TPR) repeat protein